jgi:hypothetical protein
MSVVMNASRVSLTPPSIEFSSGTTPWSRVLQRDDPLVGGAARHGAEHAHDVAARQVVDRGAELALRGQVGEGALRAEIGHAEGLFERDAGRHDFAEDPAERSLRQRPTIQPVDSLEDLDFARWRVDLRVAFALDLADLDDQLAALVEELDKLPVDGVDLPPQNLKRAGSGLRAGRALCHAMPPLGQQHAPSSRKPLI